MKDVTAQEFINELKMAPLWHLEREFLPTSRLILTVREQEGLAQYIAPSPITMSDIEYRAFVARVYEITEWPEIKRNQL